MLAVSSGSVECVDLLLQQYENNDSCIDEDDEHQRTALHRAVSMSRNDKSQPERLVDLFIQEYNMR